MTRAHVASQIFALTVLMALARLYTYHEPLEMDAATYAVVAHELRDGRLLYTDVWDDKPPAIYGAFAAAQMIFGYGQGHIYALGLLVAVLTLVGVYAAASVPPFGAEIGLWAAAFWALISGDLYLQANQPNTEAFQNLFLVWGFALLLRMPNGRLSLGRVATIGLLFALASMYEMVALVIGGTITASYLVLLAWRNGAQRRALVHGVVVAAAVATVWLSVSGYFALTGRFAEFYGAVFLNQDGGSSADNLLRALSARSVLPADMYASLPLVLLCLVGASVGRRMGSPQGLLLAAYALGTMVAVALPGRFYAHYYRLWLPLLAIGGAWAVFAVPFPAPVRQAWQGRAALVIALALLAAQLPYYRLAPQEWSLAKFGGRLLQSRHVAAMINDVLLPGETFYEWGHASELYFYSNRRPPAPELRSERFLAGPRVEQRGRKLVADLRIAGAELLLVSQRSRFPLDQQVPRWLMQHYIELGFEQRIPWTRAGYRAFYRRGGNLERRLFAHQRQTASL